MNKRDREKISTTVDSEMFEHFERERFHRGVSQAALIDEILKDRYRPVKNRFPPVPLVPGEEPRNEWQTKDLTKCRY